VAVVTKRISTLTIAARRCTPWACRSTGASWVARNGYITHPDPFVGDANTQTPEFKSFQVNIEKV